MNKRKYYKNLVQHNCEKNILKCAPKMTEKGTISAISTPVNVLNLSVKFKAINCNSYSEQSHLTLH